MKDKILSYIRNNPQVTLEQIIVWYNQTYDLILSRTFVLGLLEDLNRSHLVLKKLVNGEMYYFSRPYNSGMSVVKL